MSNIIEITDDSKLIELLATGTIYVNGGGGGGNTNLAYTASPTQGIVTSDSGTDATIPAGSATNASLMLPVDKTKLDGVASGATANATDAQLRDRSTHTGTQAISTVTGLQTALDGKQNTITTGTISQYFRGDLSLATLDKTAVGLSNVDNTSDATKNSAIATLTNKTINLTDNTLTGTTAQFNTALSDGDFATLAGSATLTNKTLGSGTIIENATGTTNVQTGTTYTLLASDNGKIITLNNASAITLTVPSGLGAGFNCTVIQKGAGQVTFTVSGTTIVNRQSHTKTAGQHAVCGLYADVANNFYLTGDTVA